jgi:hypothetical protein
MPPRRAHDSPQDNNGDSMSPEAMLAVMQAMQRELFLLALLRPLVLRVLVLESFPGALSLRVLLLVV